MELGAGAGVMSAQSAKDFEYLARDCVRLAEQPNLPSEARQQLLQMAREWMQALLEKEEGTATVAADPVSGGLPSQ